MHSTPVQSEKFGTYIESYEDLFSDQKWKPRESITETVAAVDSNILDGKTPKELEEYVAKHDAAMRLREAAIKSNAVIELDDTPSADIMTTERAILRYGHEVANEQELPGNLVDVAQIQVAELIHPRGKEVIDVPSFALGALALVKMKESDNDPFERQAAADALSALPRNPEQIELVKRETIGHDTGELAVRAILEHELVTA